MTSLAGLNAARQVPAIIAELTQRFHALRWSYARRLLIVAAANLVTIFACLWIALAVCDYWMEWPLWLRRLGTFFTATFLSIAALWSLWRIAERSGARAFAIQMESKFDSIGQRLRTLLDVENGRLQAPEAMLTALGHQTMARWETTQPQQILPVRLRNSSLAGAVCAAVALVTCALSGPEMQTALARAAGMDRSYTTLHVLPGDTQLLEGLQPEVQLDLRGRTDRHVLLRYRNASDAEWTESTLTAEQADSDRSSRQFKTKLDKLAGDLEYQFDIGIDTSPIYTIKMQPKMVLVESSAVVKPPAYTQLPERTFSIDEVTVLSGSTVTILLKANRPLKQGQLLVGKDASQLKESAAAAVGDGTVWKFQLPGDQSVQWQFSGQGEDGAPLPMVSGKLRVRQDEPPRLDWQSPVDEFAVNMLAEVPLSVLVSDDYGLTSAGIVFQLGDNEFVLKEWSLPREPSTSDTAPGDHGTVTTRIQLAEVLPLETFELSERDFVSYYAFANDNRDGQYQHTESEVRYLDIRPLKQFVSEIDRPNVGGRSKSFPVLGELITRERYLYNRTRTVARHYDSTNSDHLRTLERLVETQSELANFARYLIEFLLSQGNDNNETLAQAESVMLQASDALAIADFDTALLRELAAIRLLVEAKNTLELSLTKNNNVVLRANLSNFQRAMLNRLRRKTKPADSKVADNLKQIAAEQKRLAERAVNWLSAPAPSDEEQMKADQQELLDRLTTLNSELSPNLMQSTLATERLAASLQQMDAITGNAAKGQWNDYVTLAVGLSARLAELGEQVTALAENEPSRRIVSLRDLTASLANQEADIAILKDQQTPAENAEAVTESATTKVTANGTAQVASQLAEGLDDRAQWIAARAQTIEDVLKFPLESGDLRTSEIVDQLEKVVAEREFRGRLQASLQSAQNYVQRSQEPNWSVETRNRAREHLLMAELFDQLHKQLVAPRAAQLRRLESKANRLVQASNACLISSSNRSNATNGQGGGQSLQLSANNNGNGTKSKESDEEKNLRDLQAQLQAELQSVGLTELSELLEASQSDQGSGSANSPAGAAGNDRSGMGAAMAGAANQFHHQRIVRGHRNAMLLRQRLQAMLQELIMQETTIDRTAPIPAQYKELVDAYYKSLAGE